MTIPERVREAVILTQYALETRYPGHFEPVSEEEYRNALVLAEQVTRWAEEVLADKGN